MILTGMFHLKLLIHPELLISNGNLFHNDEPLYEALFKPRSNFLKDWQGRHQNFTNKNLLQKDASSQMYFTADYFDRSCIEMEISWHWHG